MERVYISTKEQILKANLAEIKRPLKDNEVVKCLNDKQLDPHELFCEENKNAWRRILVVFSKYSFATKELAKAFAERAFRLFWPTLGLYEKSGTFRCRHYKGKDFKCPFKCSIINYHEMNQFIITDFSDLESHTLNCFLTQAKATGLTKEILDGAKSSEEYAKLREKLGFITLATPSFYNTQTKEHKEESNRLLAEHAVPVDQVLQQCNNLCAGELLRVLQLECSKGLFVEILENTDNEVQCISMIYASQIALIADFGDCIFIDSMHAATAGGMKLMNIIVIDSNYRSRLAAQQLCKSESQEHVEIFIDFIRRMVQTHAKKVWEPRCIAADGAEALHQPFTRNWPNVQQLYCFYHRTRNASTLKGHMPALGADQRQKVVKLFKSDMLYPSVQRHEKIMSYFGEVESLLDESDTPEKSKAEQESIATTKKTLGKLKNYLDTQCPALRECFTGGSISTGRVEGENAIIRREKAPWALIVNITKRIEREKWFDNDIFSPGENDEFLRFIGNCRQITPGCRRRMRTTYKQCNQFSIMTTTEDSIVVAKNRREQQNSFTISHKHDIPTCSCGQQNTLGFPCIHMFCAAREGLLQLTTRYVHPRFLYTTERTEEVPPDDYQSKVIVKHRQFSPPAGKSKQTIAEMNLKLPSNNPEIDRIILNDGLAETKDILGAAKETFKRITAIIQQTHNTKDALSLLDYLQGLEEQLIDGETERGAAQQSASKPGAGEQTDQEHDTVSYPTSKEKLFRGGGKKVDRAYKKHSGKRPTDHHVEEIDVGIVAPPISKISKH